MTNSKNHIHIHGCDFVMEFAPSLRDEWITLQPFKDVITTHTCGPQPQAKDYDPDEPEYILLDFSIWKDGDCIIPQFFKITQAGVTYEDTDGDYPSSMRELWEYLRSIPRDPHCFVATCHDSSD
jgi:hypothetical protein